jgi:hypothetical protein
VIPLKQFIATLAAIAVIPFAAAGGFVANTDPAPRTVAEAAAEDLKAVAEGASEEWLYIVTAGPLKGQEAEAFFVALNMNDEQLAKAGATKGGFYVRKCQLYTSSGDIAVATDAEIVNRCTQRIVTRAAVLEQAKSLESPPLSS